MMFNGTVQNMKPVKIVHLIWAISIPGSDLIINCVPPTGIPNVGPRNY